MADEQVARLHAEGLAPAIAEADRAQADVARTQAALNAVNADSGPLGSSDVQRAEAEGALRQAQRHLLQRTRDGRRSRMPWRRSTRRVPAPKRRARPRSPRSRECGIDTPSHHATIERRSDPPTVAPPGDYTRCSPDEVERRRQALEEANRAWTDIDNAMAKTTREEVMPASSEIDRARDALADAEIWAGRAQHGNADDQAAARGAVTEARHRLAEARARRDAANAKMDALSKRLMDATAARAAAVAALRECESVEDHVQPGGAPGAVGRRKRIPLRPKCPPEVIAHLVRETAGATHRQQRIEALMERVNAEQLHPSLAEVDRDRAAVDAAPQALHSAPDSAVPAAQHVLAAAHMALDGAEARNEAISNVLDILGRQMIHASGQRQLTQEALDDWLRSQT